MSIETCPQCGQGKPAVVVVDAQCPGDSPVGCMLFYYCPCRAEPVAIRFGEAIAGVAREVYRRINPSPPEPSWEDEAAELLRDISDRTHGEWTFARRLRDLLAKREDVGPRPNLYAVRKEKRNGT